MASSAEAMLCLADAIPDEARWSSQLPEPVELAAVGKPQQKTKQLPLRCESFNDVNCDMGIPDGEPKAPRTLEVHRPGLAMLANTMPIIAPQSTRLSRSETDTKKNTSFPDSVFRPPRRS